MGDSRFVGQRAVIKKSIFLFPGRFIIEMDDGTQHERRWDHMMLEDRIKSDPEYRALYESRLGVKPGEV